MMMNNLKKRLLYILILFITGYIFAQQSEQQYEDPISELQREMTIIDSIYQYDLNPHTANYASEAQILGNIYEGLFSYDPITLEPQPAIAESYTVSRDRLRWVFTIRKDAKFSNGQAITANEIRDSWIRLIDPALEAPFASLIDCIAGVRDYRMGQGSADNIGINVRPNGTLAVTLTEPAEQLPRILCHHAFAVIPKEDDVYSGAYTLAMHDNGNIQLIKNNEYWDAKNTHIPSILIIQSDDLQENTFLFNTGAVQWVTGGANAQQILDTDAVQLAAQFATEYLFFRADRFPWDRSDFRNALITAVPWDRLRSNALVPAQTFIYPLTGYPAGPGFIQYDIDDAKSQLQSAKRAAGIPEDEQLELVYAIPDGEYVQKQAEILRQAWEELGIKVSIVKTPANRYFQSVTAGWKADLFNYTWIGDYADPTAFLELFRSNSTLNESKWVNKEYDQLLAQAARISSSPQRMELLSQAEQILLDAGIILPISHPVSLNFISPHEIGGWYTNALDIHPLKYLYFKKQNIEIPNLVYTRTTR